MSFITRKNRYLLSSRHRFFSSGFIFLCSAIAVIGVAIAAFLAFRSSSRAVPSVNSLYAAWEKQEYQIVYDKSVQILKQRPMDGSVLALQGFAAYYLYVEQNDPSIAQTYLNATITSLRNAWHRVSESERPQIAYILGKAYYQRGYYYADLAIKYLDYAKGSGVAYSDLAEFKGMAASLIGDDQACIAAFTEALSRNPSDMLLLTLAKAYIRVKEPEKAKQYLLEAIRVTKDELLVLRCKFELGTIFVSEQKLTEAKAEFDSILEKEPNSADAHYGLGVIYEAQGDLVRARAEWRKALRSDPVHPGAREKMNI